MGMMLDADVVIRGEKGAMDLPGWLASQTEAMELAAITVAELWHGVERATPERRGKRLLYLHAILAACPIISYTEQTALVHARIWAELEAAGKMIGSYDLVLAATALERGSTVATFNRRHFESVSGLKVIEPK